MAVHDEAEMKKIISDLTDKVKIQAKEIKTLNQILDTLMRGVGEIGLALHSRMERLRVEVVNTEEVQ